MAGASICRSCLRRALAIPSRTRAGATQLSPPYFVASAQPGLQRGQHHSSNALPAHRAYATSTAPRSKDPTAGSSPDNDIGIRSPLETKVDPHVGSAEQQRAIDTTEILFKECARQADYIVPQAFERGGEVPKNADGEELGEGSGWWYDTLGLAPTFSTWAQITFLYMYLITARLRYLPPQRAATWLQHLHDHFFYEAEHRMTLFHRISSRSIRNRYLKELYNQWRGVLGAYDEGLMKGDAVLGAAVWRNVFKGRGFYVEGEDKYSAKRKDKGMMDGKEVQEVDWRQVAAVVGFMRRALRALDGVSDEVLCSGRVKFGSPERDLAVVDQESEGLKTPFGEEEEEALAVYLTGDAGART